MIYKQVFINSLKFERMLLRTATILVMVLIVGWSTFTRADIAVSTATSQSGAEGKAYSARLVSIISQLLLSPSTPKLPKHAKKARMESALAPVISADTAAVQISGEAGSIVYVDGVRQGVIAEDGYFQLNLDTALLDGTYRFQVRLLGSDGIASEPLIIPLTKRAHAGFEVSAVKGNTAVKGEIASVDIALSGQPTHEVTLDLSSSNSREGRVLDTRLVFTAENWFEPQTARIEGQNARVVDGVQDYRLILHPVQSLDAGYNGLDPVDVPLQGVELRLQAFVQTEYANSGEQLVVPLDVHYTGKSALTYSLDLSPQGMEIDFDSGEVHWTPRQDQQGLEAPVRVVVTDGWRVANAEFEVRVTQPSPMLLRAKGRHLLLDQPGNALDRMKIKAEEASLQLNPQDVRLFKLDAEVVPIFTKGLTPLSGIFKIEVDESVGAIRLDLPAFKLVQGQHDEDIKLFRLFKPKGRAPMGWYSAGTDPLWRYKKHQSRLSVTLYEPEGIYVFGLMSVIAKEVVDFSTAAEAVSAPSPSSRASAEPRYPAINCVQDAGVKKFDKGTCTYTKGGKQYVMTIYGFKNGNNSDFGLHWGKGTATYTIKSLVKWIIDAQRKFDVLGFTYAQALTIKVENAGWNTYGAYTFSKAVANRVLTLSDKLYNCRAFRDAAKKNCSRIGPATQILERDIKATVAHEYLHHAHDIYMSSMTNEDGVRSWFKKTDIDWINEGQGEWFTDFVYDRGNSYKVSGSINNPFPRIMEHGIADPINSTAAPSTGVNTYNSALLFKLMVSKCGTGVILKVFNKVYSGIAAAGGGQKGVNFLENAFSTCNFGSHAGASNKKKITAMANYFQWATNWKRRLSSLERDETNKNFSFVKARTFGDAINIQNSCAGVIPTGAICKKTAGNPNPPAACLCRQSFDTDGIKLKDNKIGYGGAMSFIFNPRASNGVKPILGEVPPGKRARLVIERGSSGTGTMAVSVGSDDGSFKNSGVAVGSLPQKWIKSNKVTLDMDDFTHLLPFQNRTMPELFISVVNAGNTDLNKVNISFQIEDVVLSATDITITEPADNAGTRETNNRLTVVAGHVPDDAAQVNRVLISNTSLQDSGTGKDSQVIAPVDKNGNFRADVVMTVGSNNLQIFGYRESAGSPVIPVPITKTLAVSVTGVSVPDSDPPPPENSLVESDVIFILRWDSKADLDLYGKWADAYDSVSKKVSNPLVVWHSSPTLSKTTGLPKPSGGAYQARFFFDDTDGYGSEVVSFEKQPDTWYSMDVHGFRGVIDKPTNYSIDVLLNEKTDAGSGSSRRFYHYEVIDLYQIQNGDSSTAYRGPTGTDAGIGSASDHIRHNDVLTFMCPPPDLSGNSICQFESGSGRVAPSASTINSPAMALRAGVSYPEPESMTLLEMCENEWTLFQDKHGDVPWQCDPQTGARITGEQP